MKKISSKALLIIGWIVGFGAPLFSVITGLIFPGVSRGVERAILYFLFCTGVVLLTLSLAKKRIEDGVVKADNLLPALTPAQICLIVSMNLLWMGMAVITAGNRSIGTFLTGTGDFGAFVSIILALIRAAGKKNERKSALSDSRRSDESDSYRPVFLPDLTDTSKNSSVTKKPPVGKNPDPGKTAMPADAVCDKCGASIAECGTLHCQGNKYYCQKCCDILTGKPAETKTVEKEVGIKQDLASDLKAVLAE